jgi:hypothetical protein
MEVEPIADLASAQARKDGLPDSPQATRRLQRITLHECRPTFASLMIAAGVNAKVLRTSILAGA